jgi:hypothetical protein
MTTMASDISFRTEIGTPKTGGLSIAKIVSTNAFSFALSLQCEKRLMVCIADFFRASA